MLQMGCWFAEKTNPGGNGKRELELVLDHRIMLQTAQSFISKTSSHGTSKTPIGFCKLTFPIENDMASHLSSSTSILG